MYSTCDVLCVYEVIWPCIWQKVQKFQLVKWGLYRHWLDFSNYGLKSCRGFPGDKFIKQMLSWWSFIKQSISSTNYVCARRTLSAQTVPHAEAEGNTAEGAHFCTNARVSSQIRVGLDRGWHLLLELNLDLASQIHIPSEIHRFHSEDNRKQY